MALLSAFALKPMMSTLDGRARVERSSRSWRCAFGVSSHNSLMGSTA